MEDFKTLKSGKKEEILKEIKDRNLSAQNNYLEANGFTKLKRNLKFLIKFNGDQEKALEALKNKKETHDGKSGKCGDEQEKVFLEKIEQSGYSEQNNFLISKGFTKTKRNYKKLAKFNGDKDLALQALTKCKEKWNHGSSKEEKEKFFQEKIEQSGFSEQNNFLISKGFTKLRLNYKILSKVNGDKDLALEKITKRTEKFKNSLSKDERRKKIFEELETLGYSSQNKILESKGFTKPKKNLKMLIKAKGDFEKALKKIKEHCEKKQLRKLMKEENTSEQKNDKKLEKEERQKIKEDLKSWLLDEIKPGTKIAYLDGNNMLFVDENLRKLCLSHKRSEAERLLVDLAKEMGKICNLEEIIVIFDTTKNIYNQTIGSLKLSVCSARPNFETSDDALVVWMDGLSAFDSTLIVTSDVGLQIRLKEKGVKMIMKSGPWFKILKAKLSEEAFQKILNAKDSLDETQMKNLSLKD